MPEDSTNTGQILTFEKAAATGGWLQWCNNEPVGPSWWWGETGWPVGEFPPQLPWSFLGRSCPDETSFSGRKETLVPGSRVLGGVMRSLLLSVYKSFCLLALMGGASWNHPCLKAHEQTEDSKGDNAFVPLKSTVQALELEIKIRKVFLHESGEACIIFIFIYFFKISVLH